MSVLLVLVIVMLSPSGTLALPDHVPVERHPNICTSMEPKSHHHQPTTATGPPPYNIEVSSPTYKTGESIQVTLRVNDSSGVFFKGFFLQARRQCEFVLTCDPDWTTRPVGSFSGAPKGAEPLACSSDADALGHNNNHAITNMTVTWTPGPDDKEPIVFRATIVQGPPHKYWSGVHSEIVNNIGSFTASVHVSTLVIALLVAVFTSI
ncbi:putative defense protein 3 [Asterias rubens]|uniref:putative defense protein 3 n=1 Tax=Asterias rubens TaxID=7604 RepID=UPI00145576ED|nr:putative defense protein 3 [Asterias rubens]